MATIKIKVPVEVDINIPSYWKKSDGQFFAMLSEEKLLVINTQGMKSVGESRNYLLDSFPVEWESFTEITKQEFETAYNTVYGDVTLNKMNTISKK